MNCLVYRLGSVTNKNVASSPPWEVRLTPFYQSSTSPPVFLQRLSYRLMQNTIFICLEKLLQTGNVQMWLCKCTDELERLFCSHLGSPAAILPPACPTSVCLCCAAQDRQGNLSAVRRGVGGSCFVLTEQTQTSPIQVCAEQRETANELRGIVL